MPPAADERRRLLTRAVGAPITTGLLDWSARGVRIDENQRIGGRGPAARRSALERRSSKELIEIAGMSVSPWESTVLPPHRRCWDHQPPYLDSRSKERFRKRKVLPPQNFASNGADVLADVEVPTGRFDDDLRCLVESKPGRIQAEVIVLCCEPVAPPMPLHVLLAMFVRVRHSAVRFVG